MTAVEQHLVPESRVQQMQHGMFGAADVQDRPASTPFPFRDRRNSSDVLRVDESQVVPAGPGPLGHRIGFTLVTLAVDDGIQPRIGSFHQRRFGATVRLVVFQMRQIDR